MYSQVFFSLAFGSVIGFLFSFFVPFHLPGFLRRGHRYKCKASFPTFDIHEETKFYNVKPLFVGVMTDSQYLDTRATAVNQTWGSDMAGDIEFYIGFVNNTTLKDGHKQLPLRMLRGIREGVYPPVKKSFAMLRYIYENHIDEYQWFLRADDDVYVRVDRLLEMLRTLDASKDVVVGQGGIGKGDEENKLGLLKHECYCLGGPGVVISRSVLRKIGANLDSCLNESTSGHEDVELGRCIRKYTGISCLWAEEAKELFKQVYNEQHKAYHGNLDDRKAKINKAISLHPIKDPAYMYRLHYHFMSKKLHNLRYHRYKTNGVLAMTRKILSGELVPNATFRNWSRNTDFYYRANPSSKLEWEYLPTKEHYRQYYNIYDLEGRKTYLKFNKADSLNRILGTVMQELNKQYQKEHQRVVKHHHKRILGITLQNVENGYLRVNPKYGVQYRLLLSIKVPRVSLTYKWTPPKPSYHRADIDHAFSAIQGRIQEELKATTVNLIVPLKGKYEEFTRFLESLEQEFLTQGEQISLVVVYFTESSDPKRHITRMNELMKKYPGTTSRWLESSGGFNRAKALQKGAANLGSDSLLFFSDVDLVFRKEFVYRCRSNTIRGKQVYMPLMFGQYNPNITYFNKTKPKTDFVYDSKAGRWRIYSYGPVCIYNSDVTSVRGMNTRIKGWGMEDTDFAERITRRHLSIFRAPDQGIVHVYHKHVPCDRSLSGNQRYQCRKATVSTYAPRNEAVDYMLAKKYINL